MSNKEQPWPLLISTSHGISRAALMSPKAFNKSHEQGILWVNFPGNNRILPCEGGLSFQSLSWEEGCYRAKLKEGVQLPEADQNPADVDLEDHSEVSVKETADTDFLFRLEETIAARKKEMPEGSYTTHLFSKGMEKIKKKTGEELIELLLADKKEDLIYESGDLIYHLLVLWQAADIPLTRILSELERRDS